MPPVTKTAEKVRPLTAEENETLNGLLVRASANMAPAVRLGDPYIALINLSVPRRGGDGLMNDLVMAGETVHLTPEEAEQFLRHGPRDGRQVAVIRPATGPESSNLLPSRVPPRAVSGRLNAPPPPPPGSDGARPDPPGSSAIQVAEVPESQEPTPGSENFDMDQGMGTARPVDAEDIIPQRVRARQTPRE